MSIGKMPASYDLPDALCSARPTPGRWLRWAAVLLAAGWWALSSLGMPAAAQQRPLLTEDVDIVETGRIRLQAGADFFQNQRFGLSGLRGDLFRPVVLGVHFGLNSNVGFSVEEVCATI
jgi:hypothetical protein